MVKEKGFTLIEILVVVGIFAIIAVIGSGSFFSLLRGSTKSRSASTVKQNGDYALGVMERMIRNARYLEENSGGLICDSGMTEIKIKNPDGGSTEFKCEANSISSDSGELVRKLIDEELTVTDCQFDCREGGTLNPQVVTIFFTLSTNLGTGRPEEEAIANFETTVSLRNVPK